MPDLKSIISVAAGHHQAGRLAQAEELYRQALAKSSDHAGVLSSLGALYLQTSRIEQALELLSLAVSQSPDDPRILNSLGAAHLAARELDKAQTCFERALVLEPASPEVQSNLGSLMSYQGHAGRAVELFEAVVSARPDHAPDYHHLGNAHAMAGDMAKAASCFRKSLDLDPENAKAWNNLGGALKHMGRGGDARRAMEQSLLLDPLNPTFSLNLAGLLLTMGDYKQAQKRFEQVISLQPRHPRASSGLGVAYFGQGLLDQAVMSFMDSLSIDEAAPETLSSLGNALRQQGALDPALEAYDGAIAAAPDFLPAQVGRGQTLLLKWDFESGWADWEKRLYSPLRPKGPDLPVWDGSPIDGRLLLWADGSPEDCLVFMRLIPLARGKCSGLVLAPPPGLKRLSGRVSGVDGVITAGEAVPDDCSHALPLLSLGAMLNVRADQIPREPFLPPLSEASIDALPREGKRIGIAWRDSRTMPEAAYHHLPFECLSPLQDRSGVSFVPLQNSDPPEGLPLDQSQAPEDPEDVLALMAGLDLVICCEGLHAQLAAAAGIEAWVLLSPGPGWSWGLDEKSPWHPETRIFRSDDNQDWGGLGSELAEALAGWLDIN